MHSNEVQSVLSYTVIGEVTMDKMSFNTENDKIVLTGKVDDLFFDGEAIPRIIANKHAFSIRLTTKGKVVKVYTILITDILSYSIDQGDGTYSIHCKYTILPTDSVDPRTYYVLDPTVTHIYANHGFIGITVEGEYNTIRDWANKNMQAFRHGNTVYHLQKSSCIRIVLDRQQTIDSIHSDVFVIFIASDVKVPSATEYQSFMSEFSQWVKNVYGLTTLPDF